MDNLQAKQLIANSLNNLTMILINRDNLSNSDLADLLENVSCIVQIAVSHFPDNSLHYLTMKKDFCHLMLTKTLNSKIGDLGQIDDQESFLGFIAERRICPSILNNLKTRYDDLVKQLQEINPTDQSEDNQNIEIKVFSFLPLDIDKVDKKREELIKEKEELRHAQSQLKETEKKVRQLAIQKEHEERMEIERREKEEKEEQLMRRKQEESKEQEKIAEQKAVEIARRQQLRLAEEQKIVQENEKKEQLKKEKRRNERLLKNNKQSKKTEISLEAEKKTSSHVPPYTPAQSSHYLVTPQPKLITNTKINSNTSQPKLKPKPSIPVNSQRKYITGLLDDRRQIDALIDLARLAKDLKQEFKVDLLLKGSLVKRCGVAFYYKQSKDPIQKIHVGDIDLIVEDSMFAENRLEEKLIKCGFTLAKKSDYYYLRFIKQDKDQLCIDLNVVSPDYQTHPYLPYDFGRMSFNTWSAENRRIYLNDDNYLVFETNSLFEQVCSTGMDWVAMPKNAFTAFCFRTFKNHVSIVMKLPACKEKIEPPKGYTSYDKLDINLKSFFYGQLKIDALNENPFREMYEFIKNPFIQGESVKSFYHPEAEKFITAFCYALLRFRNIPEKNLETSSIIFVTQLKNSLENTNNLSLEDFKNIVNNEANNIVLDLTHSKTSSNLVFFTPPPLHRQQDSRPLTHSAPASITLNKSASDG